MRFLSFLILSVSVGCAAFSEAAEVTTLAPTNVTTTGATLNGSVTGTGDLEYLQFSVSAPGFAGAYQPTPSTISGNDVDSVSRSVTGPSPNTTYTVKLMSTRYSDGVQSMGQELTFTTAPLPPTILAQPSSSNVFPTRAFVQSYIHPGSLVTSVFWDYGLTTDYGQTLPAISATESGNYNRSVYRNLTGLLPSTTYHYRVRLVSAEGSATSEDQTFTTPPGPALTSQPATQITDLTATLNGTVTPDNRQATVFFDYGTSVTDGVLLATVSRLATPNTVSGTAPVSVSTGISGLLPSTVYHYKVRLVLSGGETYQSALSSFTTGPAATAPVASAPGADRRSMVSARVFATVSAGSSDASVVFEYGPETSYGSTSGPATVTYMDFSTQSQVTLSLLPTSSVFTPGSVITGLQPNTTYHFRAKATNSEGTTYSEDATFTTLAPPSNITTGTVIPWATDSVRLEGSYNPQGGSYNVSFEYGPTNGYGSTIAATPPSTIGGGLVIGGGITTGGGGVNLFTPQTLIAVPTNLTPATTYHYRFVVEAGPGTTLTSADATFTTPATPLEGWRAENFQTFANAGDAADDANPAGDGIPNLMKYALGQDPKTIVTLPQPTLQTTEGGEVLEFVFNHVPANSDLRYEVEAADSPAGPWTAIATRVGGGAFTGPGLVSQGVTLGGGVIIVTPTPAGTRSTVLSPVTVRDIVTNQTAPRRFMRLRVTRL